MMFHVQVMITTKSSLTPISRTFDCRCTTERQHKSEPSRLTRACYVARELVAEVTKSGCLVLGRSAQDNLVHTLYYPPPRFCPRTPLQRPSMAFTPLILCTAVTHVTPHQPPIRATTLAPRLLTQTSLGSRDCGASFWGYSRRLSGIVHTLSTIPLLFTCAREHSPPRPASSPLMMHVNDLLGY